MLENCHLMIGDISCHRPDSLSILALHTMWCRNRDVNHRLHT